MHGREVKLRYDFRAAQMDERLTMSPLVVRDVDGGRFGDVHLSFDHGIVVDVFVVGGLGENWRLVVRPDGEDYVCQCYSSRK